MRWLAQGVGTACPADPASFLWPPSARRVPRRIGRPRSGRRSSPWPSGRWRPAATTCSPSRSTSPRSSPPSGRSSRPNVPDTIPTATILAESVASLLSVFSGPLSLAGASKSGKIIGKQRITSRITASTWRRRARLSRCGDGGGAQVGGQRRNKLNNLRASPITTNWVEFLRTMPLRSRKRTVSGRTGGLWTESLADRSGDKQRRGEEYPGQGGVFQAVALPGRGLSPPTSAAAGPPTRTPHGSASSA